MALERIAASGRKRRRPRRATASTNPRILAYARVSTTEQAEEGAGMFAQRMAMELELRARGWTDVRWIEDPGYSAATLDRPGITEALALLEAGQADVLLAAKMDRLSRSSLDFATLVARAQEQGWSLRVLDLGLDMESPQGALMATVLAGFAEFERRLIGQRTRDGMRAKAAQGVRMGRPVMLSEAVRADIASLRSLGLSYREIARRLNERGVPSARGSKWHPGAVHGALHGWGSTRDETGPNESGGQDRNGVA
jgi:DNA invertase Pin-like site-specific DNA recombinase